MSQTLEQFQAYQTRLEKYDQAIALLYWDLQTAAPKDSIEAKLSAVGYFSTESFRLSTADEYGSLLKKLSAPEEYDQLSPAMQLTIRRNLRDFERFKRIPEAFYTEYVTEKARSEKAWEAAKEASDFSVFAPHLDKVISMTKEYVHYMEPDQDVYEFLVGLFEDGMDTETIDRIFAELKEGLLPLLAKIEAAPKLPCSRPLTRMLRKRYRSCCFLISAFPLTAARLPRVCIPLRRRFAPAMSA